MNINPMRWLSIAALATMLASCGEEELAPITVSAQEFVMEIEENPEAGLVLGTIMASTNRGELSYEISSQDPANGLVLDPITGELSIGDASLFDFESRQFVTAMVKVSNDDKEDAIIARINITDGIDNPRFESLVGHYPLDVDATDLSSYGNDGVVEGATPTTNNEAQAESALLFDGQDDVVMIPHAAQYNISNEVTISAMVNVAEMKSGTIVRKGANINGTGKAPYTISVSGTGLIVFEVVVDNGETSYDLRGNMYELDEWTMITGVLSGGKMSLYLDGQLVEEGDAPGVLNTNSSPLLIGSRSQSLGNTFAGAIDDVRLYETALTAKEIEELYGNYFLLEN